MIAGCQASLEVFGREDVARTSGMRQQLLDGDSGNFLVWIVHEIFAERRVQ
jgi:hypothetical protein